MLSKANSAGEAYEECLRYSKKKLYEKTQQCFELLRSRYPGTVEAIEADIEIADNYFRQKDHLVAAEAYKNFARLHPAYDRIDYVYYRTGLSYLKESPKAIDRDQDHLEPAIHYFSLTLSSPQSEFREAARQYWNEARRRMALRTFYIGRFYYRTQEYLAAIPRFEEVVMKHSDLGLDEESLYYLGTSYLKIGRRDKSLEIVSVFDQHFPKSRYRKRLARKLGV